MSVTSPSVAGTPVVAASGAGTAVRARRRSARRTSARAAINLAALVVFVVSVFPVYWMVSTSLLPNNKIRSVTPTFAPTSPTLRNFRHVLDPSTDFVPALRTSLLVTVLTVVVALFLALLAAVALTRFRFRSRRLMVLGVLVIQMLPAEAMIITIYRLLNGWQLTNTVIGLGMVYVATVLPFTIWTLRGFVAGVPVELEEAARIDGCSRVRAFFSVTFPLMAPGLIATGVFAFIQAWNEFLTALVLMNRPEHRTLPVWLRTFKQVHSSTDWGAIMAGSTLMTIPVIVFFLFVQGRMTTGLVSGAVKG
ncbi:N,N'-diacetylchitobiose transport system permease protein [Motilibacter peucedani]|uniref:N,N'-diacetylchitobiose transport system permease protein n=1 Tax=Motilibacter peucedani TaxID=598650 RepID=A0A420XLF2_9ACTN|nr:carbohydrate ABC transporter permease [Motilibacter peucedani]RKS69370.1 N,N'-diacetylchitobiose transport system permease protein [Motilibacter peucedani]